MRKAGTVSVPALMAMLFCRCARDESAYHGSNREKSHGRRCAVSAAAAALMARLGPIPWRGLYSWPWLRGSLLYRSGPVFRLVPILPRLAHLFHPAAIVSVWLRPRLRRGEGAPAHKRYEHHRNSNKSAYLFCKFHHLNRLHVSFSSRLRSLCRWLKYRGEKWR